MLKILAFLCSFLALILGILDFYNFLHNPIFSFIDLYKLCDYLKLYITHGQQLNRLQNHIWAHVPLSILFSLISISLYTICYSKNKNVLIY